MCIKNYRIVPYITDCDSSESEGREKGRDLAQSYDKSTYIHRKKKHMTIQNRPQNLRLQNDSRPT